MIAVDIGKVDAQLWREQSRDSLFERPEHEAGLSLIQAYQPLTLTYIPSDVEGPSKGIRCPESAAAKRRLCQIEAGGRAIQAVGTAGKRAPARDTTRRCPPPSRIRRSFPPPGAGAEMEEQPPLTVHACIRPKLARGRFESSQPIYAAAARPLNGRGDIDRQDASHHGELPRVAVLLPMHDLAVAEIPDVRNLRVKRLSCGLTVPR